MRTFSQYVTFIGMGVFVVLMLLAFNAAGSSPDDGFGFGWAFFGMLFLVILVQGLAFAVFSAWMASLKGRGAMNWFCLGFWFSFIAAVVITILPTKPLTSRH
ncbi:MAG: hypothetical protein OXP73_08420 [Chloroflexota bacterium]|nr:hypothetical protein [Chloroflexota bacterium]